MRTGVYFAFGVLVVGAGTSFAQELRDPIEVATESGICGDLAVATAVYLDNGTIEATCEDDAVAFLPLAAPLAGLLGLGLLAATGGGGTNSTSGTTN